MSVDRGNESSVPLTGGALAIILVVGAYMVGQSGFVQLRPVNPKPIDFSNSSASRIEARLWQDPFAAVDNFELAGRSVDEVNPQLTMLTSLLKQRLGEMKLEEEPSKLERYVLFAECWRNDGLLRTSLSVDQATMNANEESEKVSCQEFAESLLHGVSSESVSDELVEQRVEEMLLRELGVYAGDPDPGDSEDSRASFRKQLIEGFVRNSALKQMMNKPLGSLDFGVASTLNELSELTETDFNTDIVNKLKGAIVNRAEEGKALVLGVVVPGGPYAELTERRMRSRYATIAALDDMGYSPDDPEHIQVWRAPGKCLNPYSCVTDTVPYEWFERRSYLRGGHATSDYSGVVVMWLRDGDLASGPIAKLLTISARVDGWLDAVCPKRACSGQVDYKFLGPYSSAVMLDAFEEEYCGKSADGDVVSPSLDEPFKCILEDKIRSVAKRVRLYNWSATIDEVNGTEEFSTFLPEANVKVLPNSKLAESLTQDLDSLSPLAGLWDKKKPILLVYESDSEYSRHLADSFDQAINDKCKGPKTQCVVRKTYLRGLDGQLPGDAREGDAGSDFGLRSEEEIQRALSALSSQEQPIGRSQYDYLRRLAGELNKDPDSYSAIGVLGSDVYDKVLVMQALKPTFPATLFFTTDLDTSLLSPSISGAVRNTLVVTSHGLKPTLDESNWTLFRDSYQTSLYDAVAQASGATIEPLVTPKLFEVGRGRFYQLESPVAVESPDLQADSDVNNPSRVHTDVAGLSNYYWRPIEQLLIVFVVTILLFSVLQVVYPHAAPRSDTLAGLPFSWIEVGAAGIFVTALFSLRWILPEYVFSYEPFSWSGGISALPPIIFILGGCSAALIYCSKLQLATAHLARYLNEEVFENAVLDDIGIENRKSFVGHAFGIDWLASGSEGVSLDEAKSLLSSKVKEDNLNWFLIQAKRLCIRGERSLVVLFAGGSGALMFLLYQLSEHANFHLRTAYANSVSILLIVLVFVATTFLLCRIVHLTQCLTVLMRKLGSGSGHWEKETVSAYAEKYCLSARYLRPIVDARVIAETTELLYRFYYAPFFVIAILFASRWVGFAPWPLHTGELIYLAYLLVVATLCAIVVRREAIIAQEKIAERNNSYCVAALDDDEISEAGWLNLDRITNRIESETHGVYAPLSQQPAFRLVALSLGSGGIVLFQYFFGLLR